MVTDSAHSKLRPSPPRRSQSPRRAREGDDTRAPDHRDNGDVAVVSGWWRTHHPAVHMTAGLPASEPVEQPRAKPAAAARTDGSSSQQEPNVWASLDRATLQHLIVGQIPRFRTRPYLTSVDDAVAAIVHDTLEGDYCWSLEFSPPFIRSLCSLGFLPICSELGGGTGLFVLLPKLHERRCVLQFDALHVPKKLRRRIAREGVTLTVDDAFDAVIAGCLRQHGAEAWLHPPLRSALAALRAEDEAARGTAVGGGRTDGGEAGGARTCCFALWRGDELVAGEFGVVCGRVYTSFSGFYTADGAGAMQMVLTAKLLAAAGFAWWDLGCEHEYKRAHGAQALPRRDFLDSFCVERERPNALAPLLGAQGTRFDGVALLAASDTTPSGVHDGSRCPVPS